MSLLDLQDVGVIYGDMADPDHVAGVKKATSRSVAIGRVSDAAIPARGAGRAQIQL